MKTENKTPVTFGEATAPLVAAGLDPCWLEPAIPIGATLVAGSKVRPDQIGKIQGEYRGDGLWAGRSKTYDEGAPALTHGRTQKQIEAEQHWPTPGVLIVGQQLFMLDPDGADSVVLDIVLDELTAQMGSAVARAAFRRVRADAPHRAGIILQAAVPGSIETARLAFRRQPGAEKEKFEIIGAKAYFVAGGSPHPRGCVFEWQNARGEPYEPGRDWRLSDVPTATADDMRELMARVRKRIEELGWEIVEAGQGAGGDAGERRDVLQDEPQITLDLAMRILARIAAAPGVFESHEQAVAVHCAFAAALGRDFDEFDPDLQEWSNGYDGDTVWTDNLMDNIRRDGVSVTAWALVPWVEKHAPDLGAELARMLRQQETPSFFTEWGEDDQYPDVAGAQASAASAVHPITGKPRYLAKEIIARARKSVAVAAKAPEFTPLTMPSDWDEQAKSYKTPLPIIEDVVFPGVVHGIVAPPNAGKSLYLVHCASAAVHGYPPRDPMQEATPCNVVLALAEDAEAEAYKRFSEAKRAHANGRPYAEGVMLPRFISERLELAVLDESTKQVGEQITPDLYKLCDVLEAMIHRFQTGDCPYPIALMLDTLKDTFTGDENQRWQVDAVIKHLWGAILACVRDAGGPPIGIVFTHHMTRSGSRSVMEGKGNATAAFAASGSIGIDANSRRITQLAQDRQDSNLVQACVTKNNNGPTGVVTWWRRVPSPDGSTVHLAPSAGPANVAGVAGFVLEPAIAKLHAYASAAGAPLISHGRRKSEAAMSLGEALGHVGFTLEPAVKEAFVQAAVGAGAFRSGQTGTKNGKRCETLLKPVPGWVAPRLDDDDIINGEAA